MNLKLEPDTEISGEDQTFWDEVTRNAIVRRLKQEDRPAVPSDYRLNYLLVDASNPSLDNEVLVGRAFISLCRSSSGAALQKNATDTPSTLPA